MTLVGGSAGSRAPRSAAAGGGAAVAAEGVGGGAQREVRSGGR